jgi:oxygen-independent coproporphyrinogen-3 oxidase
MAGLYLHIPFCRKACHYCDFHFSTSLKQKDVLLAAMLQEIEMQHGYLQGAPLESVYFGGGTPSLLGEMDLEAFFEAIHRLFPCREKMEVTLEANPDDLTDDYLKMLRQTPVNRLSIGVQSFFDEDLKYMNRSHDASQARKCLESALAIGFDNLTVDLIYGSPTTSMTHWAANLDILLDYNIKHLSAYCLTVEEGTALHHFVRTGKSPAPNDAHALSQFEVLMDKMDRAGFLHYEISNFAQEGHLAIHNTNYWKGKKYLGVGPSAHSYNGHQRQWNIANNALYVKSIQNKTIPFELEELSATDQYNEYVMTSLRTTWGCSLGDIAQRWGTEQAAHFEREAARFLANESLCYKSEGIYTLTRKGKFVSDSIAAALFA